jgi:hypothetical protein
LHQREKLNLERAFMDVTFAGAEKGASPSVPPVVAWGAKIIAVEAGNSLPVAISVASASPVECHVVKCVRAGSFLDQLRARLVGDKVYAPDPFDRTLWNEYDINWKFGSLEGISAAA